MSSPSLRGSGLKSSICTAIRTNLCGLPLYEGVDWNVISCCNPITIGVSLFTREWIEIPEICDKSAPHLCLPLYEGVDWNSMRAIWKLKISVSLFTREWIEICRIWTLVLKRQLVSLFTREWIEIKARYQIVTSWKSPSLRGSGLK